MRTLTRTLSVLALAATTALTGAAHAQEDLIPLRVGYDGFTMTTTPMMYAMEQGLFEEHGLDVELLYVEGGSVLTQALVGGSVDMAQNGYAPALAAAVAGAELKIIGGIANVLPMILMVDPEITDAESLRGARLAISRYGSATDAAVRIAVESLGLTAEDVNILQIGGEGTRIAAYLSDQVDGLMAQYPGVQDLLDQGAEILVRVNEVAADYPNTAYVTSDAFLAENPEAIRRFFMAMAEGLQGYLEDPEGATEVTAEFLETDVRPALQAAVEFYGQDVFQRDLRPSVSGVQAVLDDLAAEVPAAADMSPEDVIDTSVLDGLEEEGFFETIGQ